MPITPIGAVRASRGSSRLFLVGAASAVHAHYLTERLGGLASSPWTRELIRIGPSNPTPRA